MLAASALTWSGRIWKKRDGQNNRIHVVRRGTESKYGADTDREGEACSRSGFAEGFGGAGPARLPGSGGVALSRDSELGRASGWRS